MWSRLWFVAALKILSRGCESRGRAVLGQHRGTVRRVTPNHLCAEFRVCLELPRGAGVMGLNPERLGCEAERDGGRELVERAHQAIEPPVRAGAQAVGPAEPGADITHAQF